MVFLFVWTRKSGNETAKPLSSNWSTTTTTTILRPCSLALLLICHPHCAAANVARSSISSNYLLSYSLLMSHKNTSKRTLHINDLLLEDITLKFIQSNNSIIYICFSDLMTKSTLDGVTATSKH
jgi:hypothetical protein